MADFIGKFTDGIRRSRALKKAQALILNAKEEEAIVILTGLGLEDKAHFDISLWLAIAYSQGKKYKEAMESVDKALLISPNDPVAGLVKGEILISMERYDEAIGLLSDCLEKNSDNTRISYLLGLAWLKKGEIDKASTLFESVIKYDRDLVESRLLAMAELYLHKNKK